MSQKKTNKKNNTEQEQTDYAKSYYLLKLQLKLVYSPIE